MTTRKDLKDYKIKFKDLIVSDCPIIEQLERRIKERNPDVEIDEIEEVKVRG